MDVASLDWGAHTGYSLLERFNFLLPAGIAVWDYNHRLGVHRLLVNVHARRRQLACVVDGHGCTKLFAVEAALNIAQLLTVILSGPAYSFEF